MITMNIPGPIKLIIITFYPNDDAVKNFVAHLHESLNNKDIIIERRQFLKMNDASQYFQSFSDKYTLNHCLMIVTHGKKGTGLPTYEETKKEPGPHDELVEEWSFMSWIIRDAGFDRLVFLAVCYSGHDDIVDFLTRGPAQILHMVTPYPKKSLQIKKGAEAMALFLDNLVNMNLETYTPDDLQKAMKDVEKKYPKTIRLWEYGDTIIRSK